MCIGDENNVQIHLIALHNWTYCMMMPHWRITSYIILSHRRDNSESLVQIIVFKNITVGIHIKTQLVWPARPSRIHPGLLEGKACFYHTTVKYWDGLASQTTTQQISPQHLQSTIFSEAHPCEIPVWEHPLLGQLEHIPCTSFQRRNSRNSDRRNGSLFLVGMAMVHL